MIYSVGNPHRAGYMGYNATKQWEKLTLLIKGVLCMKRIFVTGGAGFIGSHLAEHLVGQGYDVVVYDNLTTGRKENLEGIKHTFLDGDIRDYDHLHASLKHSDIVFHLAALTSVAQSMENMDDYISVNVQGTVNVLKAAKAAGAHKVLYASSATVYGDSQILPKQEDMRLEPLSPYAITKLDGEYYCNVYRQFLGLKTVCTRFFNVFGEKQDPNSPYAAAIPIFISRALRNDRIGIYGDGTQTRDFIYVKDLVNAMIFLMEKGEGVFNLGYGRTISVGSLVNMITHLTNSWSEVAYVPERAGEIKHSYASVEKLSRLGFSPAYSFESGLQRALSYYRGNNAGKMELPH